MTNCMVCFISMCQVVSDNKVGSINTNRVQRGEVKTRELHYIITYNKLAGAAP